MLWSGVEVENFGRCCVSCCGMLLLLHRVAGSEIYIYWLYISGCANYCIYSADVAAGLELETLLGAGNSTAGSYDCRTQTWSRSLSLTLSRASLSQILSSALIAVLGVSLLLLLLLLLPLQWESLNPADLGKLSLSSPFSSDFDSFLLFSGLGFCLPMFAIVYF